MVMDTKSLTRMAVREREKETWKEGEKKSKIGLK